MQDEYDFSESVKNPYAKRLKKQVTIRLEEEIVDYFKELSLETEIPYQSLINLYLKDCIQSKRKLSLEWTVT
ncbi:MAG: BrnA antitoxin family protein [Synechococcales cyanobacterium RM1_1_8]|nr:BrnA antitoxin family protein [Synechococcales cyanobacterium RM1_1_8]